MKLVFLHGVGDGGRDRAWLTALNARLVADGSEPVREADVIAPFYAHLLSSGTSRATMPKTTAHELGSDARPQFQTRQANAIRTIGRDPDAQILGFGGVADAGSPSWVAGAARVTPGGSRHVVDQVNRYLNTEGIRAAIVGKVLAALPTSGEVVLVGHSLGSVVAIDVISRIPIDLRVKRIITIGSPASSKVFGQSSDQLIANFPYSAVGDWLNFFSPRDPITRGCGLSTVFSDVRDIRVKIGMTAHSADRYMDNSTVARAVARGFHEVRAGSRRTTRVTTALTDDTASKLLEMHYCDALEKVINPSTKARFAEAVRIRRDDLVDQIWKANDEGIPLPREFHILAEGKFPALPDYWTTTQLVAELTILALSNPIAPFEIEVDGQFRKSAFEDVLDQAGRDPKIADKVHSAVDEVAGVLKKNGIPWGQIAVVGAGLAIIALAPLSLAAVAPAGVAGGAAITSSLAALGPGGMVGGIATVSGIAGTGAAVTTAAAVRRRSSSKQDVAMFVTRATVAYVQFRLGLDYDDDLPGDLAEARSDIAAEKNQLTGISDNKSAMVVALQSQEQILKRLADFLESKGVYSPALQLS